MWCSLKEDVAKETPTKPWSGDVAMEEVEDEEVFRGERLHDPADPACPDPEDPYNYYNNRKPCDTVRVGGDLNLEGFGVATPHASDLKWVYFQLCWVFCLQSAFVVYYDCILNKLQNQCVHNA